HHPTPSLPNQMPHHPPKRITTHLVPHPPPQCPCHLPQCIMPHHPPEHLTACLNTVTTHPTASPPTETHHCLPKHHH
ncbi:hypothetical protein HYDPIDRAFT_64375, partial [Hydnomerulius pinastri MD-312]